MGRQDKDEKMKGSSIMLLQERFKELERLKETREKRKLINNHNNNKLLIAGDDEQQCSRRLDDDHVYYSTYNGNLQTAAFNKDPLALELNSNGNHVRCFRAVNGPQDFPRPAAKVTAQRFLVKHDVVDTSLRL